MVYNKQKFSGAQNLEKIENQKVVRAGKVNPQKPNKCHTLFQFEEWTYTLISAHSTNIRKELQLTQKILIRCNLSQQKFLHLNQLKLEYIKSIDQFYV